MKWEDALFWILFVMALIVVALLILGNSPTIEQALLFLILSLVIKNTSDLRELKERARNNEKRFQALASDFKEHIKHS